MSKKTCSWEGCALKTLSTSNIVKKEADNQAWSMVHHKP